MFEAIIVAIALAAAASAAKEMYDVHSDEGGKKAQRGAAKFFFQGLGGPSAADHIAHEVFPEDEPEPQMGLGEGMGMDFLNQIVIPAVTAGAGHYVYQAAEPVINEAWQSVVQAAGFGDDVVGGVAPGVNAATDTARQSATDIAQQVAIESGEEAARQSGQTLVESVSRKDLGGLVYQTQPGSELPYTQALGSENVAKNLSKVAPEVPTTPVKLEQVPQFTERASLDPGTVVPANAPKGAPSLPAQEPVVGYPSPAPSDLLQQTTAPETSFLDQVQTAGRNVWGDIPGHIEGVPGRLAESYAKSYAIEKPLQAAIGEKDVDWNPSWQQLAGNMIGQGIGLGTEMFADAGALAAGYKPYEGYQTLEDVNTAPSIDVSTEVASTGPDLPVANQFAYQIPQTAIGQAAQYAMLDEGPPQIEPPSVPQVGDTGQIDYAGFYGPYRRFA